MGNELKEVKTINEKSQSKSKKKPTDQSGGTLKTKRLVKVKRTPSSSSDSSTDSNNNHAANRQKPTQNQRTKPGPDSAVGSMIQYDADVESLDRGGQRRVSDGTVETGETSSEAVKETKRYLPDSYNEEYDEMEESIVINQSPEATPQSGPSNRKIKRSLSEQQHHRSSSSNDTKIDIVETHLSS